MKITLIISLFFFSIVAKSQTIENDPFLKRLTELKIIAEQPNGIVLKQNVRGAAKAQRICKWGDKKRMELHSNGVIYQFKKGLADGMYTAFYDKNYKDTAMLCVFENKKINGLLKRWDYGHLVEEVEYKNGQMIGWRKLYFYDEEGNKYTNIQYVEEGGGTIDVITTW